MLESVSSSIMSWCRFLHGTQNPRTFGVYRTIAKNAHHWDVVFHKHAPPPFIKSSIALFEAIQGRVTSLLTRHRVDVVVAGNVACGLATKTTSLRPASRASP